MAWDDDYSIPAGWSETEAKLYDDFVEADDRIGNDAFLQGLFDAALFEGIHGGGGPEHDFLMDSLREYLEDTYGIDFDDIFDWEAWREWYEDTA